MIDIARAYRRRPRPGDCTETDCPHPAAGSCQAPLRGRKLGQKCGRKLCRAHARRGLCGPHIRQATS